MRWTSTFILCLLAFGRTARGQETCVPPTVVYVNFDGGTLRGDPYCEDSVTNCSGVIGHFSGKTTLTYRPFRGTQAEKQQFVDLLAAAFRSINVRIVVTRPAAGPYNMLMVGGLPSDIGDASESLGLAVADCGNRQPSNIAFVFTGWRDVPKYAYYTIPLLANAAGQEAAHGFGLAHVTDAADIMYAGAKSLRGTETFQGTRMSIDRGPTTIPCDSTGYQNDIEILTANLGRPHGPGEPPCTAVSPPLPVPAAPADSEGIGPSVPHEDIVSGCQFASGTSMPVSQLVLVALLARLHRRHRKGRPALHPPRASGA